MAEGVEISKPRNERIEHWLQRATAHMNHAINGQLADKGQLKNVSARRFIHRNRKRGLTWQQTKPKSWIKYCRIIFLGKDTKEH